MPHTGMMGTSEVNRPNLLVIMADEHAPQFSGFGGHPQVQTPHLDWLAQRGSLFPNSSSRSKPQQRAEPLLKPAPGASVHGRSATR